MERNKRWCYYATLDRIDCGEKNHQLSRYRPRFERMAWSNTNGARWISMGRLRVSEPSIFVRCGQNWTNPFQKLLCHWSQCIELAWKSIWHRSRARSNCWKSSDHRWVRKPTTVGPFHQWAHHRCSGHWRSCRGIFSSWCRPWLPTRFVGDRFAEEFFHRCCDSELGVVSRWWTSAKYALARDSTNEHHLSEGRQRG